MGLIVDGIEIDTNAEGFLLDTSQWNAAVAAALARANNIDLSEAHWEIVLFIREYYTEFKHLPNARMFATAIKKRLGDEKGQSRYLQTLFPQGPLKYACKLAGLPKPPTCL